MSARPLEVQEMIHGIIGLMMAGGFSVRVQIPPSPLGWPVMNATFVSGFFYARRSPGPRTNAPRRDYPAGSPDDVPVVHYNVLPLRFCEKRDGAVIELGTVPGGTRSKPYV